MVSKRAITIILISFISPFSWAQSQPNRPNGTVYSQANEKAVGNALIQTIHNFFTANSEHENAKTLQDLENTELDSYNSAPARVAGLRLAHEVSQQVPGYSREEIINSWENANSISRRTESIVLSNDGMYYHSKKGNSSVVRITKENSYIETALVERFFKEFFSGNSQILDELDLGLDELLVFLTYKEFGFDLVFKGFIEESYGENYAKSLEWLASQNFKDGLPKSVESDIQIPLINALILTDLSNLFLPQEGTEPTQAQIDARTALLLVTVAEVHEALNALRQYTDDRALHERVVRTIEIVIDSEDISDITKNIFTAEIFENAFLTAERILGNEQARGFLSQHEETIDTSITSVVTEALMDSGHRLELSLKERRSRISEELDEILNYNKNFAEIGVTVAAIGSLLIAAGSAIDAFFPHFTPYINNPIEAIVSTLFFGRAAKLAGDLIDDGQISEFVENFESKFSFFLKSKRKKTLSLWKQNLNIRLETMESPSFRNAAQDLAGSLLCKSALGRLDRTQLLPPPAVEK